MVYFLHLTIIKYHYEPKLVDTYVPFIEIEFAVTSRQIHMQMSIQLVLPGSQQVYVLILLRIYSQGVQKTVLLL